MLLCCHRFSLLLCHYILGAVAIKLAQDEHKGKESDLRKDKRSLKVELKEQELSNEDVIKSLLRVSVFSISFLFKLLWDFLFCIACMTYCNSSQGKDEEITTLRNDFERQAKGLI